MYLYSLTETSSITVKNVYERDDVLSNYHDLRTKPHLVLDFDNAMPGFTLLRIYDVREWNEEVIHLNDDGLFLTNKTWKREKFIDIFVFLNYFF
jgi:hypothetical protein